MPDINRVRYNTPPLLQGNPTPLLALGRRIPASQLKEGIEVAIPLGGIYELKESQFFSEKK